MRHNILVLHPWGGVPRVSRNGVASSASQRRVCRDDWLGTNVILGRPVRGPPSITDYGTNIWRALQVPKNE